MMVMRVVMMKMNVQPPVAVCHWQGAPPQFEDDDDDHGDDDDDDGDHDGDENVKPPVEVYHWQAAPLQFETSTYSQRLPCLKVKYKYIVIYINHIIKYNIRYIQLSASHA